ncbi:Holliday junction branch migration protein RuvA [Limibaculum sp. M0105]|uniref:Holliday junction branch migration complex subunit RuvA n=1 Tax=Thermohalobaculum xanthum TaxID=2753746 RepID=A0A8J7M6A0_9RHOB|nr:Holliday junction branch migration protein RuvA [Thermohalobaculum xanthum]MBK0399341.1 Holliday junction branch migration protein RuvA [Thermohalobaculum xanthum]
MIGKITGRVDYVAEDHALIEAAGVGYIIFCAPNTLASLPAPGEVAALYTELVVREDLMQLYGFRSVVEREWHRLLTSVQGVGAKVSLAILGTLGPDGVSRALALGDAGAIRRAPGVGPKLAARVVNELKDKAPAVMALGAGQRAVAGPVSGASAPPSAAMADDPGGAHAVGPAPVEVAADANAVADALSALVNLGYERGEAARAVAEASEESGAGAAHLIKAALKRLAPTA